MSSEALDDDLIEQLAEREAAPAAPKAETGPLAQVQGDLATLAEQLRRPEPPDPYRDESDCQAAVERAAGLAHDASQQTFVAQAAPDEPAVDVELGALGHYKLLAKLGQGGMGAVYRALHTKLDRVVALKVLPAGRLNDQQAVSRFEREMRAVGKLQHPHIVAAHDAGEVDGTHYLVMELVEGLDLAALVQQRGPLPIAAACELIRQAALGLAHAHKHGLVHRDIKPSNLMLARPAEPGAPPVVKVLDLGLALLDEGHVEAAGELTSTGQVMGTIDYMAPEQGTDTHKVDIRADIYSLGATLYKLLTGKAPFAGAQYDTAIKKLMALATKEPPPVGSLRPDCPPELARLVHQMLAKAPASRPTQPADAARALEPFSRGADLQILLNSREQTAIEPPAGTTAFARNTALSAFDETHVADASAAPVAPAPDSAAPRASRRRRLIALGAFAATVACGVIFIIVTDKGTVEIDAPEGADFKITVLRNDQPVVDGWQIQPGENQKTVRTGRVQIVLPHDVEPTYEITNSDQLVVRGKTTVFTLTRRAGTRPHDAAKPQPIVAGNFEPGNPIDIPEPPPLEEWLKGREVLAVAQDGSAQFTTIQAALNALQPGQVVKVLDRGPYRERIRMDDIPADTGLVSDAGTILELPEYQLDWKAPHGDEYLGHLFRRGDGFRIAGLVLGFPADKPKFGSSLLVLRVAGFLLERCWVKAPSDAWISHAPGAPSPNCVRECAFEGRLVLGSESGEGRTLVSRNYFGPDEGIAFIGGLNTSFTGVSIRHNIFAGERSNLQVQGCRPTMDLEISNNTFTTARPCILFAQAMLRDHVTICNNVHTRPGLIGLWEMPVEWTEAACGWRVGRNSYQPAAVPEEWDKLVVFPSSVTDILTVPKFLSMVPGNPDYLRMADDDPLARAGAGGARPVYVGALPPGPAPKDGDWFTRLRQRWPAAFAKPPAASPVIEKPVGIAEPVQIPEPPPLEEWLKDREVLTVAQDGSAQFKTIQAALDALKPGQAVQVLDRGPYTERFQIRGLPPDCGLVSKQKSVIELAPFNEEEAQKGWANIIALMDGFRLSGFRIMGPPGGPFVMVQPSGLVVEDCHFCWTSSPPVEQEALRLQEFTAGMTPAYVRNCEFDAAACLGVASESCLVIEQNYFSHGYLYVAGPVVRDLIVRHNVFEFRGSPIYVVNLQRVERVLEIRNNTSVGNNSQPLLTLIKAAPPGGVLIRNNISDVTVGIGDGAWEFLGSKVPQWELDHNCYLRVSFIPRVPSDIAAAPKFLSNNNEDRDYLRIATDTPLASGGAGGGQAKYMGALAPGSAPQEGDWFTRLRERWPSVAAMAEKTTRKETPTEPSSPIIAKPLDIPEPPPLDEWLKGREVLTVSQDGSAQFKTIQAALDALQAGQVVKVLDRGPYHERLDTLDLPEDTGLVSEAGTILEATGWKHYWTEPDLKREQFAGHYFLFVNGFRVSGFTLIFPPATDKFTQGLLVERADGLVFENCCVRAGPTYGVTLSFREGIIQKPACVRECRFEASLNWQGGTSRQGQVLVARNYFPGTQRTGLELGLGNWSKVAIRNNIFDGGDAAIITASKDLDFLEISNNLLDATGGIIFAQSIPRGAVTIFNNLRSRAGFIELYGGAELMLPEALRRFQVGNNCFLRETTSQAGEPQTHFPRAPADILFAPRVLSKVPASADYLRIAAGDPIARGGAGGAWPDYIGPLPPGPAPAGGDWFTRLRERW